MSKLKVLILGDLIIDRYTFVRANSLSSKNNILSSVKIKSENYYGGAASVFFHLKDFVKNLKFVSLVNTNDLKLFRKKFLGAKLFAHDDFKTIIKHKYVQDEGEMTELKKYFSVTNINEDFYSKNLENKILNYLNNIVPKYDLVMVLDFGHNFFTKKIINIIEKKSSWLSVNCQTNSLNYGFNIINKKYKRADSFTLDKTEMMLASAIKKDNKFDETLKKVKKQLKSQYAWLTLGNKFTIGIKGNKVYKIKPLTNFVRDSVGAGDAFYSISSLLSALKVDIYNATFLSQVAGSIKVKSISNKKPLNRKILKGFIKNFF
jgi:bifunctional ADP-heptose synthase (sugar kinase/adenylyltransferase)